MSKRKTPWEVLAEDAENVAFNLKDTQSQLVVVVDGEVAEVLRGPLSITPEFIREMAARLRERYPTAEEVELYGDPPQGKGAWGILKAEAPRICEELEELSPPALVAVIDGKEFGPFPWATQAAQAVRAWLSLSPEEYLTSILVPLAFSHPNPTQGIELYAFWPGSPPRRHRVAHLMRTGNKGAIKA